MMLCLMLLTNYLLAADTSGISETNLHGHLVALLKTVNLDVSLTSWMLQELCLWELGSHESLVVDRSLCFTIYSTYPMKWKGQTLVTACTWYPSNAWITGISTKVLSVNVVSKEVQFQTSQKWFWISQVLNIASHTRLKPEWWCRNGLKSGYARSSKGSSVPISQNESNSSATRYDFHLSPCIQIALTEAAKLIWGTNSQSLYSFP